MSRWNDWAFSDVLYGLIAPCIVGIAIIVLSQIGFVMAFSTTLLTIAIPVVFGLIWNRWAGGCSGFLVGSIYTIGYFTLWRPDSLWYGNTYMLSWIVGAMVAGYVAGALSKGSENFKRLVISSVVATVVGANFSFIVYALVHPYATIMIAFISVFISTLIYVALGVGLAAAAKLISWFQPKKQTN